jgi:hypothetical protein
VVSGIVGLRADRADVLVLLALDGGQLGLVHVQCAVNEPEVAADLADLGGQERGQVRRWLASPYVHTPERS